MSITHIAAAQEPGAGAGDVRQVLPRQQQRRRAVMVDREQPRLRRLAPVRRPQHGHAGDEAQRHRVLDRLVGRAVLAQEDRVVREHIDRALLHQRREPQRAAHVVGEREERRAVRDDAAVQRHAVQDAGHAVLADAEVQVPARAVEARERARLVDEGLGRAREIGRAAPQLRQVRGQRVEHLARGRARRRRLVVEARPGRVPRQVGRELAGDASASSSRGELGVGLAVGGHRASQAVRCAAPRARSASNAATASSGTMKAGSSGQPIASLVTSDLGRAERRAVGVLGVLLVGRALADVGPAGDERRLVAVSARAGRSPLGSRRRSWPSTAWTCQP